MARYEPLYAAVDLAAVVNRVPSHHRQRTVQYGSRAVPDGCRTIYCTTPCAMVRTPGATSTVSSLLSPPGASPLRTPASERALKVAEDGLGAAELLEKKNLFHAASELKAITLLQAREAYDRRHEMAKRSPLGRVQLANGAVPPPTKPPETFVSTLGFPTPPKRSLRKLLRGSDPVPPAAIHSVIISTSSHVQHLDGKHFTLYQLHVPLENREHVVFRRFSDFEALDKALQAALRDEETGRSAFHRALVALPCICASGLPTLPPKTLPFFQDATDPALVTQRWTCLQKYLDAVLERVVSCKSPLALETFKDFISLP